MPVNMSTHIILCSVCELKRLNSQYTYYGSEGKLFWRANGNLLLCVSIKLVG